MDSVSPDQATQGDTGVVVTFTLSGNPPPYPGPTPDSADIGTIAGYNITRLSTYTVQSTFDIPVTETTGFKDVSVIFPKPGGGEIVFSGSGLFEVLDDGVSTVVYVDADNTSGTYDGTSWATAFQALQAGIDAAYTAGGGEVWVAEGIYMPTTDTDRTVSFALKSGVAIYGGFAGGESKQDARDPTAHPVTLSGDIGVTGVMTDNVYHVLIGADNATLDGVTVSGGYADGGLATLQGLQHGKGGGLLNYDSATQEGFSPILSNVVFEDNYAQEGGAMYNLGGSFSGVTSSPIISACTFQNNSAGRGGAILNRVGAHTLITASAFIQNYAQWRGGAIEIDYGAEIDYSTGTELRIEASTFLSNTTDGNGGAIEIDDWATQLEGTRPIIARCVFTANVAAYRGGAIHVFNKAVPQILDGTFTANHAGEGGGAIAVDYDSTDNLSYGDTQVKRCTFEANTTDGYGGALYLYNGSSTPRIEDGEFYTNTAVSGGGAIAAVQDSHAILQNATFSGNTSSQGDADVYVDATSSVEIITGSAYRGYNLFTPLQGTDTYLIDNDGDLRYTWPSNYNPGLSVYLLENGQLLRTGSLAANTPFSKTGGVGGIVEVISPTGVVSWSYQYATPQHQLHHDVEMLPNGNILMIAWEYKTQAQAIDAGRDSTLLQDGELWPDTVIEVDPTTDQIVWKWHAWDHLIQEYDDTKPNYGTVANHPELINLNYVQGDGTPSGGADWLHINAVDYNEAFDQILLSVRNFSEIWVIDHSTTITEAAGHTGGTYGKGGDLLYRWGNPAAYRAGPPGDQQLFVQHDARWIPTGYPGAGNILVFNNGQGRSGGNYSSVDEIIPPVSVTGTYILTGSAYYPLTPTWSYTSTPTSDFFASNISGAERLPNGNTLICDGPDGRFFEVTAGKDIVWEHHYGSDVFRVTRYATNYAGIPTLSYQPIHQARSNDFSRSPTRFSVRSNDFSRSPTRFSVRSNDFSRSSSSRLPQPSSKSPHIPNNVIRYVNVNNTTPGDGTSWATAFTDVQSGIDAARSAGGGEVWVAAGTYKTTSGTDRSVSFVLTATVAVYGGFDGIEDAREQRDWEQNVTILSGDIGVEGLQNDNAYHVVRGANNAILDGFTITGGNARGEPSSGGGGGTSTSTDAILAAQGANCGGGILNFQAAPTLRNLIIIDNRASKGGGVYNMTSRNGRPDDPQPAPTFTNVRFESNYATSRGGGMSNDVYTHPALTNTVFISNTTDAKGGGMYNDFGCSPTMVNCLFVANEALRAGAMGNDGSSSPTLINCTFSQNRAEDAGAALYQGSYMPGTDANNPTVINSIFWGNTSATGGPAEVSNWHETNPDITYSIVAGGYAGTGNLDDDPLFADAASHDYHLSNGSPAGSPAIDAGTPTGAPFTDLDGNPRDAAPDMGAYEALATTLTIHTAGDGSGTVGADPDQASYATGTVVTLTATPDPGSTFAGWTGAVTDSQGTVTVTMTTDLVVTATFDLLTYTLTLHTTGDGSGSVTVDPDQATYTYGSSITLTAVVSAGSYFAGWTGSLTSANNPTTLIMDGDKVVTATFTTQPPVTYTLSVTVVGSGTVAPSSGSYISGTRITLEATPDVGWAFDAWTGALVTTTNPVSLTMDADKAMTATFSEIVTPSPTYTLAITIVGNGTVTPTGGSYVSGTVVTLEATADSGWQFDGWTGAVITTTNPVSLTLDADKTVTATFGEIVIPPPTYTLTVNVVGSGTVTPTGGSYVSGTPVTLEAIPAAVWEFAGWQFDAWSGALITTANPVSLTMDSDKVVTATFSEIVTPPPTYTLTVNVVGSGIVTPTGGSYVSGTVLTVEAAANNGWRFAGWTGALVTTTTPVSLTMDADKAVTATFSAIPDNRRPTADAGIDQAIAPGDTVTLDGAASTDPDGDVLTYLWRQDGGPTVSFTPTLSRTTFTAPNSAMVLTFTLTVTDTGELSDGDAVVITVEDVSYRVFLPLVMRE